MSLVRPDRSAGSVVDPLHFGEVARIQLLTGESR
jgi:hypothetical protein